MASKAIIHTWRGWMKGGNVKGEMKIRSVLGFRASMVGTAEPEQKWASVDLILVTLSQGWWWHGQVHMVFRHLGRKQNRCHTFCHSSLKTSLKVKLRRLQEGWSQVANFHLGHLPSRIIAVKWEAILLFWSLTPGAPPPKDSQYNFPLFISGEGL